MGPRPARVAATRGGVVTSAHLVAFGTSLAVGLLIGVERERSGRGEEQALGVRTFALVALVGTLAAQISPAVVVVVAVALSALVVLGYRRTSAQDRGTTTEVAALATYLIGVLCDHDAALAAALGIVMTVLLVSRSRLHEFARDILSQAEVEDALKFLVIAFVVLPILPDRGLGPYHVLNPARIWLIVVILTGISWVGYVAVRVLGPRRGLVATGFASGFVSSTATTASMGRASRDEGGFEAAVAGAQISSVATYLQLEAIMTFVSPRLALRLLGPALLGAGVLLSVAVRGFRRHRVASESVVVVSAPSEPSSAHVVTLLPAVLLAAILTAALLLGRWGAAAFGTAGAVVVAGAAGLADAHGGALTAVTLFAKGSLSLVAALGAVGAAMTTNSIVKVGVAIAAGGRHFARRFALGFLMSVAVFLGSLGVVIKWY